VVGWVPAGGDLQILHGVGPLIRDQSLVTIVDDLSVDEIVIAMDDRRGHLPLRELLDCKLKGVDVIDIVEFLERESDKVRVDLVNPSWLVFSPGFRASRLRKISKRVFDFLTSAAALLVLWPLMALVAIAIKIEDGVKAPALFRQIRVGQFGEDFAILKFRSMRENAEEESGAVWAVENDPRVTRVGRFLRKVRLDEIPQLFNVLRGEMSLVGPRPERPEFVEELVEKIPYYEERHTAKPGITGWAQVRYSYASSAEDTIQKLQYDLYYVKNGSLVLDITIILQTLEVVIWGKGAR
jgi:sugar transferase (PEP-CTERM system associated)